MNSYKIIIYSLACLLSVAAVAQTVPPSADAGRIENRLNAPVAEIPDLSAPEIKGGVAEVVMPKGAEKVVFLLKELEVQGASAYSKQELAGIYTDKVGKEVSLADVYRVAAAITQRYSNDGYVLSQAVVPPQEIKDGKVVIVVTEGYIGEIKTEGDDHANYITRDASDRILAMRPLNGNKLEHIVLLLNDTGVKVKAILAPVEGREPKPGEALLRLVFTETPLELSAGVDNYGTRYTGPLETTLKLAKSGVLTPYDQASISTLNVFPVSELSYLSAKYQLPLTASGLSMSLLGSTTKSNPGYRLKLFDVQNNARNVQLALTYPLIRSRAENLSIASSFTMRNIKSDILDTRLYEDRIRTFRAGGTYNFSDSFGGVNLLDISVTKGLNILNATRTGSIDLSRANGHSDFTKIEYNASRLQVVNDYVHVYVAATAQYAYDPLLSSEQFGFGGQRFGRGYDNSEISGDRGIAGSVEVRLNHIADVNPFKIIPFAFYDIGKAWTPGTAGSMASAASAGVGAYVSVSGGFSANIVVAKPLTQDVAALAPNDRRDTRAFFSLNYQY